MEKIGATVCIECLTTVVWLNIEERENEHDSSFLFSHQHSFTDQPMPDNFDSCGSSDESTEDMSDTRSQADTPSTPEMTLGDQSLSETQSTIEGEEPVVLTTPAEESRSESQCGFKESIKVESDDTGYAQVVDDYYNNPRCEVALVAAEDNVLFRVDAWDLAKKRQVPVPRSTLS